VVVKEQIHHTLLCGLVKIVIKKLEKLGTHENSLWKNFEPMKIISGGQTGADREALETARDLGIETGGFVPKGWLTEDGPDPSLQEFGCVEHRSTSFSVRTRANVFASHGTVWFGKLHTPGHHCTKSATGHYPTEKRPFLENPTPGELREWIKKHDIRILNVAGNRRSKNPGISKIVRQILTLGLTPLKEFYV
jgi:hypothetical protein